MSAWVIALGLSAGYLINKNLTIKQRAATARKKKKEGAKGKKVVANTKAAKVSYKK